MAFPTDKTVAVDGVTEIIAAHLNHLEDKVGINNSADPNSLDYQVFYHNHQAPVGVKVDHGLGLTGLGDDDHTQYTLLAGRATGQTLYGGVAASENLYLNSTSHATKGKIYLGDSLYFDEARTDGIVQKIITDDAYGTFNIAQSKSLFAGSARYDQVLDIGYNMKALGAQEDPTEPSLGIQLESFYSPVGGTEYSEMIFAYSNGAFGVRPFQFSVNRNTNFVSMSFAADDYYFNEPDGSQAMKISNVTDAIYIYQGKYFDFDTNNTTCIRQLDSTGTQHYALFKLNASNKLQFQISATFDDKVGIHAVPSPVNPLSFAQYLYSSGTKLSLHEEADGSLTYGFGVTAGCVGFYANGTKICDFDYRKFINFVAGGVIKINSVQVVGARVIDARCDDTIDSGDATTDGVIDALRDAMIAHGLIAAA